MPTENLTNLPEPLAVDYRWQEDRGTASIPLVTGHQQGGKRYAVWRSRGARRLASDVHAERRRPREQGLSGAGRHRSHPPERPPRLRHGANRRVVGDSLDALHAAPALADLARLAGGSARRPEALARRRSPGEGRGRALGDAPPRHRPARPPRGLRPARARRGSALVRDGHARRPQSSIRASTPPCASCWRASPAP